MGSCINSRNNLLGKIEWGPGGYSIEEEPDLIRTFFHRLEYKDEDRLS